MEYPRISVRFPEFSAQVYSQYRALFEAYERLQTLPNQLFNFPVKGDLAATLRRLAILAWNSFGAVCTLVLNGYGNDAMKIVRGLFESEINLSYLQRHPDKLDDYLAYEHILRMEIYRQMSPQQQAAVPPAQVQQVKESAEAAKKRLVDAKGKPFRHGWCEISIRDRAKEAGRLDIYNTVYRWSCSMHHGDVGALIWQVDSTGDVDIALSRQWLGDALRDGYASMLRCLEIYEETAHLDLKQAIEAAGRDYVEALRVMEAPAMKP